MTVVRGREVRAEVSFRGGASGIGNRVSGLSFGISRYITGTQCRVKTERPGERERQEGGKKGRNEAAALLLLKQR